MGPARIRSPVWDPRYAASVLVPSSTRTMLSRYRKTTPFVPGASPPNLLIFLIAQGVHTRPTPPRLNLQPSPPSSGMKSTFLHRLCMLTSDDGHIPSDLRSAWPLTHWRPTTRPADGLHKACLHRPVVQGHIQMRGRLRRHHLAPVVVASCLAERPPPGPLPVSVPGPTLHTPCYP